MNLKYSKQREAIKTFLMSRKDHPTADQIYTAVREDHPNISLGTVYRNLAANLPDSIKIGANVSAGQVIGSIGESSLLEIADEPHLHLEMTVGGLAVDPRDYFSDAAAEALKSDTSYESSAVGEEVTEDIKTGK